jgi:hypothetical protein
LLHHADFYCPTMLNDFFRYYNGCESCQKFKDAHVGIHKTPIFTTNIPKFHIRNRG